MSSQDSLDPFQIFSDDLDQFAEVRIDTDVYGKAAVFKSAYWYTDTCYLFIDRCEDQKFLRIQFRAKGDDQLEPVDRLAREFCNRLVDQQVREQVAVETGEIRDALVKKAFFEGRKPIDPLLLNSDESALEQDQNGETNGHPEDSS